jgi:hypothetical protein
LVSDISIEVLSIDCVDLAESSKNLARAARCSLVAVGEISAVSSRSRRRDDFPVPLPPTT